MVTAPLLLVERPSPLPLCISSFAIEWDLSRGNLGRHGRAATVVMHTTPALLLRRPTFLEVFEACVAVVLFTSGGGRAAAAMVLTAPVLLSRRPSSLPIGVAGLAVVENVGRRGPDRSLPVGGAAR